MKAKFTAQQPIVNWRPLENGNVDVTICLNGLEVTEEITHSMNADTMNTHTEKYWEYDFRQFREKMENINLEMVLINPDKYLDYLPVSEKPLKQTIVDQEQQIRMLKECLMEMSKTVYA